MDSVFTKSKRNYILKSLKYYFTRFQKPFHIYFHGTSTDINCQIADYCSWAMYIKAERNETRPYEEIKTHVGSHIDILENSDMTYYSYKK
jgi:hypothetical protein